MAEEKKSSINFVIVLLVVVSFFAGYLFFKLQALEKGSNTNQAANSPTTAPSKSLNSMPKLTKNDHILGSLSADIVLVEYSDLECPFCKTFHSTMQQVVKDYGDKVAWVYRQYPLSFHQNAQKEAEASECVAELGGNEMFWKYIDAIYERTTSNGTGFALDKLQPLAEEVGVDGAKFKQCLDSGKYAKKVQDDEAGGAAAGIQGTPGTIIVTKSGKKDLISGALPIDKVKAQIDALLK